MASPLEQFVNNVRTMSASGTSSILLLPTPFISSIHKLKTAINILR